MGSLYYPPTTNGLQKTLDSQLDEGVTAQATLNNVTGVQNKKGVFVVDRIDTSGKEKDPAVREYIGYTGYSGNNLVTLTRGLGGSTDQDHATGAVVEFIPDVTVFQALIDALLKVYNDTTNTLLKATGAEIVTGTEDAKIVTPRSIKDAADGLITLTDVTTNDVSTSNHGFVPKAPNDTTKFLRGDGSWAVPSSGADGWSAASGTWAYSSADDPTFVASIDADLTGVIGIGDRIKLTQTTVKYFIVTAITSNSITLYGGTDYDLANAAVSNIYYSHAKAPLGFPISPIKWTVEATDTSSRSQASAASTTWYNLGGVNISIPIGVWRVYYKVQVHENGTTANLQLKTTLSTANNSESDADFTYYLETPAAQNLFMVSTAEKTISVAAKTPYYINTCQISGATPTIYNLNDRMKLIIRAVSAYL